MNVVDNKLELKLISQLMDQLQSEMEYGEDDFSTRLGRKKPELEVVKIEGKMPAKPMETMDEDMEMSGSPDTTSISMDEEALSPEEELKKRLMKLRG